MPRLTRRVDLPVDAAEAFAWHERPGALDRLTPPWEPVRVEHPPDGLAVGARVVLRLGVLGLGVGERLGLRWVAEHTAYDPPHHFTDVQRGGPFASWTHTHRFQPAAGGEGSALIDEVDYRLPFGALGSAVAGDLVRDRLTRVFDYRHRTTAADLAAHRRAAQRGATTMHVAVTGASGLIGSALTAFLTTGGHRVSRLVRRAPQGENEIQWHPAPTPAAPAAGRLDPADLRGVDAVVHLAGESLVGRWSADRKRRIMDSRVDGTALVAGTLAAMDDGPRVLVSGSGINAYGFDRGDETLTEDSTTDGGFLGDVVAAWEGATQPAIDAGVRTVHLRTGIVQTPLGSSLRLQLPLFKAGVGGRLGSGRQWTSWITLDDIIGLIHHALVTDEVVGPLNGTSPEPVRNAEHARVLGRVLGRPALVPVPPFGPALLLGSEGARETAFVNLRVLPEKALATGYAFRHPDLETGLRHLLGRTR